MDSKPPVQAKPTRRKVHVVYYLSRGGGQMDHPHLLEGYLSAAQDGLRLRDFKRWLSVLRGKSMPSSFAWSYKRTYKNGFIWHDLGEHDLIQPLSKNEYVLMGSEIKEQGASIANCKCGGMQQQAETKVVAEVGDIQEEPMNKPVLRSPKVVTRSSSYNAEEHRADGLAPTVSSPARLPMISSENKFHDSGTRIINKSNLYRGGASSRSFNDLTAQKLLEEVKRSTNHHEPKPLVTMKGFNSAIRGPNVRVPVRDCEIIAEEDYIKDSIDVDEHIHKDSICDGHEIEDDINGTYIVDAATQTGDSTRCSTEDHQDGTNPSGYNNMVELVNSPGGSAKLSTVRRVSSARFNNSHNHALVAKGNLPINFSQEFSNLPDVEKSILINQLSEAGEIPNTGHVLSSNHTSLHNHMGSPGALSSCSAMSARSNTRFARHEGNRMPVPATPSTKKYGVKPEEHHHRHHYSKGTSSQYSSNTSTMTSSSAPHNLLKQLLTCGNADVVSEKKPNNTTENVMVISNNALSGLQTPSRPANVTAGYQEGDKSKWAACKASGLMKRMSSAASSDNRSVISATASEQGSMRDTMEMISSPESVYTGSRRTHLKRDIIRVHSLSASSAAAALRSQNAHLSPKDYPSTPSASHRKIHHQQPSAATGSTSPGMLSVASSTSRRSSIRENEVNIVGGGDVEEGFHEALQSHHIGMRVSSKSRGNKGNKNTLLINDILDRKESPHDIRDVDSDTTNSKRGRSKAHSATVSELHKLICNPGGTPTCGGGNGNKVTSTNFVVPHEQSSHDYDQPHIQDTRESYTPQHTKSHHVIIATHGNSRTPTRSSNLNSPSMAYLSKSLNSPSSLFLEAHPTTASSSHGSSWKELLWSPRNGSAQKEKEKRHMKP